MSREFSGLPRFIFKTVTFFATLFLQFFLATSSSAQLLDYGAYEDLFDEPVTTSVTGSPQRASDVPASLHIITADEIRRSGARDIPGVLRHVTGLNVTRWTNSGVDVSVRGYNSAFNPRLLVMINGRQVYADHYGYVPWSVLPVALEEIRQIEVVKGPNSALFGFNAVGGVINIITFNPQFDDVSYITLSGGTQDTLRGSAAVTVPVNERAGIRVSANARQNDDFDTPQRSFDQGTRLGDELKSLGFESSFNVTDNIQMMLESSYVSGDQTVVAPNYQMIFQQTKIRSVRGRLSADTAFGLIDADIYENKVDDHVSINGYGWTGGKYSNELLDFRNKIYVYKLQDIFKPSPAHVVRLTGEYRKSSVNTTPIGGGEVSYAVKSASAMWNWQILDALSLSTAVRRDRLSLHREGAIPAGMLLTNADWDRGLKENSYNVGVNWDFSQTDTFRLIVGSGKQLPSLYSFGSILFDIDVPREFYPTGTMYITGVPTVMPATVENYELSWERHFPALGMDMTMAYFVGETRDTISDLGGSLFEAGIVNSSTNLGDSDLSGFEMSLEGQLADDWQWGLGYVYEDIEDFFGPGNTPEITMKSFQATTPMHVVNANLGWHRGAWTVDAFLRYESGTRNFRSPEDFTNPQNVLVPVPGFTVLDAHIAYRMNDRSSLELSGKNLLKASQIQHSGPAVERSVLLGLTVEF